MGACGRALYTHALTSMIYTCVLYVLCIYMCVCVCVCVCVCEYTSCIYMHKSSLRRKPKPAMILNMLPWAMISNIRMYMFMGYVWLTMSMVRINRLRQCPSRVLFGLVGMHAAACRTDGSWFAAPRLLARVKHAQELAAECSGFALFVLVKFQKSVIVSMYTTRLQDSKDDENG